MGDHVLKTWPDAWDAIANGSKRFEWRRDDRGFAVGDWLILEKWDPNSASPVLGNWGQPRTIDVRVTYILRGAFGIPDGFCVMSIRGATFNESAQRLIERATRMRAEVKP